MLYNACLCGFHSLCVYELLNGAIDNITVKELRKKLIKDAKEDLKTRVVEEIKQEQENK